MVFRLSEWQLAFILFALVFGITVCGLLLGHYLRHHVETLRESFGVLQAALLGLVGLILAFGMSLAVGRYEDRRAAVVADANSIGTAYLRAQTLPDPVRSRSLPLLVEYTNAAIRLAHAIPGSTAETRAVADGDVLQRRLWRLAGQSLNDQPVASAPRLYVDSLNNMIDQQTVHVSALNNQVPGAVLALEVLGAVAALGLLAVYVALLGRGMIPVLVASALVTLLLLVTFDLDRPTRGLIRVPATPLTALRASMLLPPAASGASHP